MTSFVCTARGYDGTPKARVLFRALLPPEPLYGSASQPSSAASAAAGGAAAWATPRPSSPRGGGGVRTLSLAVVARELLV